MAINLATKYASEVDEVIVKGSLTGEGVNNSYDFLGAQSVKVYTMGTAPLNDYKATGANRYGVPTELDDTTQEMTMTQQKSFSFTIDKTNAVDSPEGVRDAAKALRRQLDLVVIPEIDRYRLSKIAEGAATKKYVTIDDSNPYKVFLAANEAISENEMPEDGRIAFVTAEFLNHIKLDGNYVKPSDMAQEMLTKGVVGEVDGVKLIKVPKKRMPAGVSFIITNSIATTAPSKISDYKIHDDPPGIAGRLVEGLFYYDCFVLEQKKGAIAVAYGYLGELSVEMAATETGKGVVTVTGNTNGAKLVYKTGSSVTAPNLGDDISKWTELPADGVISAASGNKIVVAASADGKAVATTKAETVTVGA